MCLFTWEDEVLVSFGTMKRKRSEWEVEGEIRRGKTRRGRSRYGWLPTLWLRPFTNLFITVPSKYPPRNRLRESRPVPRYYGVRNCSALAGFSSYTTESNQWKRKGVVPKRPDTSGLQNQRRLLQRLPRPAHCKRAENMSVRDEKHIPLLGGPVETGPVEFGSDFGDEGVEAGYDVFGGSFFVSIFFTLYNKVKELKRRKGKRKKERTPPQDIHPSKYPTSPPCPPWRAVPESAGWSSPRTRRNPTRGPPR